ncbi:MAG: YceI family protein [Planctomycetota bacterium]
MNRKITILTAAAMGGLGLAGAAGLATGTGAAATAADAESRAGYTVDLVHSNILFMIRRANVSNFYGRFNDFSGEFHIDEDNPSASYFRAEIDVASVDTGNNGRDRHLRNADFFNVPQYPKATFESTGFRETGRDGIYELTGTMTLHGQTNPVTAEVEYFGTSAFNNQDLQAFEARFAIKRADFGITQYLPADGGDNGALSNTVELIISVNGVAN